MERLSYYQNGYKITASLQFKANIWRHFSFNSKIPRQSYCVTIITITTTITIIIIIRVIISWWNAQKIHALYQQVVCVCVCGDWCMSFTWYILSHMKVWPPSISRVCPALRGRAQGLVTTPSFWRIFFLHCIASSTIDLQRTGNNMTGEMRTLIAFLKALHHFLKINR